MTTEQFIGVLLGMLAYFILEFRAKGFKWSDISPWFWTKDNIFNLCTTAIIIMIWTWLNSDSLTKWAAFGFGYGWNSIWDRMEDMKLLPKILMPPTQQKVS